MNKPVRVSMDQTELFFAVNGEGDFGNRGTLKRTRVKGGNPLCSRCKTQPHTAYGRYCRDCHNAHAREYRKTHPMNREQRQKDSVRSIANVYQRRGKILKQPCEVCGALNVEKHHDDYSKPLEVRWLCRKHHIEHHKRLRAPTVKQFQKVQMEQRKRRSA